MLDIVHYCFESDAIGEKEEQDAKRKMRGVIYNELYRRPYTWGQDLDHEFGTQETASGEVITQVTSNDVSTGGKNLTHKPYIPPTPMDADAPLPFGNVLDAPLG
jgi:hypothetical protein